ncbi:hypothetical protein ACSFA2_07585 [Variovorax sp. LT2P21]|uniref:hypothetical protein n=1 Tax=Variovorax sp. LT2P21 TaxID=3443731 RepID=UPI003F47C650
MPSTPPSFFRHALLALVCAVPVVAVQAQTAAQPTPVPPAEAKAEARAEGRRNQKIENIHVEDGGAAVDEVRYGGQTQSITVQPKANVPSYQVLPNDGGRERQGQGETGSGGNGPRVWNVMKF